MDFLEVLQSLYQAGYLLVEKHFKTFHGNVIAQKSQA